MTNDAIDSLIIEKTIASIPEILSTIFSVWFIYLYYASVKKCFRKDNKSRIKLFLLTLVANPMICYILSMVLSSVIIGITGGFIGITVDMYYENQTVLIIFNSAISGIIFMGLLFLLSWIIGKWLGTPNWSLVIFVTLMFGVIFALSINFSIREADDPLDFWFVMDLLEPIMMFVASLMLYRYVITALAELTNQKRTVNAKLFIIPPMLFCMFYTLFAIGMIATHILTRTDRILVHLFSTIILLLFIWAFYVIIKNINATNEAIEAKDMAAQMARAEARIEADLNAAKSIQSSALPSVFPAFPGHKEFELFASMNAAKEVGGDFYDFCMIGDNTLVFLIADVSGKSIPGAMFMMTAKTIIRSLAESGMPPAEVFTTANEKLCEGNEAEMFVTAWLGYLDLKTGLVRVANAGHNPPVLIRDGKAEFLILRPGLMLAGMEDVRYHEQTVQLNKGDILYLYTDGVTEAMNSNEDQYGEDRLLRILSFGDSYPDPAGENGTAEAVCNLITADMAEFTAGAERSDDVTMLCIRYLGE